MATTDKVQTVLAPDGLVQLGEWFTLEVIAQGETMSTRIDGKTVATLVDATPGHATGHIALQQLNGWTRVEFRKIEIKVLSATAKADSQPFVILGGKGVAERKFDTLAEAVIAASKGDTIEVRGNGPFVTEPISIHGQALTIRAGEGFHPVIRLSPKGAETVAALFQTDAPLMLEGLELQRLGQKPYDPKQEKSAPCLVRSLGKSLHVANCRFRLGPGPRQVCIYTSEWDCTVRNCEFLGPIYSYALTAKIPPSKLHNVDNCLFLGLHALLIVSSEPESGDASIQLTRNTFVSAGTGAMPVVFLPATNGKLPADVKTIKPIRLEATANIFDAASALLFTHESPLPADDAELLLRGLLAWQDGRNLYNTGGSSLAWASGAQALPTDPPHGPKDLAEWRKFWGTADADSLEGTLRYQGGDLQAKLTLNPDKLTPEDFRLRSDSAGYKADKDGKDLGADVDLVGPGPAYERWKETPEYQQWLKETAQLRAAAGPAVPKLLIPAAGAVLANGARDRTKGHVWEFSWAAVPGASRYHLQVTAPMAPFAVIDIGVLTVPFYRYESDGWTARLKDWRWKVRAFVNGQWTGWSEERPFEVEPPVIPGAFVIPVGAGNAERKFDTLADAVQAAGAGDIVEIRGNGPFVSDGVKILHSLVIRAGEGYTPSLTLSQASANKNIPLLNVLAGSLVLEGLELRRIGGADVFEGHQPRLLRAWKGEALHLANCRLILDGHALVRVKGELVSVNVPAFSLRNCQLSGEVGSASAWHFPSGGRCHIENCVSAVGSFGFHHGKEDVTDVGIRVCGNTTVGNCLRLHLWSKPNLPEMAAAAPPIHLEFSRNVTHWDASKLKLGTLYFHQVKLRETYSAAEAEALLPCLVHLEEQQNVYLSGTPMLHLAADWKLLEGTRGQDLADWNKFWGKKNTGSVAGEVRFHGGDLIHKALTAPEQLTGEDFRLQPDSAGYKAGKDGKDIGANVDLVGPGPAYERWKKTPEYQQWLKDTKQVK